VNDVLEPGTGVGISKHNPAQSSAVERAGRVEYFRTEGGDYLGESGRTRGDRIPRELISVDDVGA
jgi:hypothetical protein